MKRSRAAQSIRPLHILAVFLGVMIAVYTGLAIRAHSFAVRHSERAELWDIATSGLGLTDLCIATEARYTRHPAVTDPVAPFMDHPEAIEHFPTGSFWAPSPAVTGKEEWR